MKASKKKPAKAMPFGQKPGKQVKPAAKKAAKKKY